MTAATLLTELHQLGIEIWAHGDRLRYKPRSAVNAELRTRLVDQKADLLQVLEHPIPILETRVLVRTQYGTEVVEIQQLSPPGPTRWEKRLVRGSVALVGDVTENPKLAQQWIDALHKHESKLR